MDIFDLALSLTPRVGNKTIEHLLQIYGSAEQVFAQSAQQLIAEAQITEAVAKAIASHQSLASAEKQAEHSAKHNILMVAATDDHYPTALKNIHDAPYIIYVMGDIEVLSRNLISMVGTRKLTSYGERNCLTLVSQIAKTIANPVIVSGLAFGADSVAHRAAIDNNIPTVAVVPTALPTIAPTQHNQLAQKIVEAGGALLSEVSINNPTNGKGYISRNRIIAGLSQATIVVESKLKGGSMSTAAMALNNGRFVGAVPGRTTDISSEGCNRLISLKSATLVSSVYDIIRELNWEDRIVEQEEVSTPNEEVDQYADLSDDERQLLRCFATADPIHISELEQVSGLSASQLGATLMTLELAGKIRMLAGARYERMV